MRDTNATEEEEELAVRDVILNDGDSASKNNLALVVFAAFRIRKTGGIIAEGTAPKTSQVRRGWV